MYLFICTLFYFVDVHFAWGIETRIAARPSRILHSENATIYRSRRCTRCLRLHVILYSLVWWIGPLKKKPFEVDKRHLVSHKQTIPNCDLTEKKRKKYSAIQFQRVKKYNKFRTHDQDSSAKNSSIFASRKTERKSVRKISESVPIKLLNNS